MLSRRRVRLRWVVWSLVSLMALLVGGYCYLTEPSRLRTRVLAAMQACRPGSIAVGEVAFSPWHGLEISDLVITPRGKVGWYQRVEGVQTPPLLRIGWARVDCDLLGFLCGRIRPKAVELRDVAVTVVCGPACRPTEPETGKPVAAEPGLWAWLTAADRLPPVTIAQADLQVMAVERGRPQVIQRWLLRATGRATAAGYELRVDRRPTTTEPLADLGWTRRTGELGLTLDWADLKTIRRVLPDRVTETLKRLDLAGRARVERLVFRCGAPPDSEQLVSAELRLADARCVLPLEADNLGSPVSPIRRPGDCFLQVSDASATLAYRRADPQTAGELELRAEGRLRGAPATFSLRGNAATIWSWWADDQDADQARSPALGLDDVLQAELWVEGLELPTAQTHPEFVRCRRLPGPVRAAFDHYQPRGPVNLWLAILPPDTLGPEGNPLSGEARIEGEIQARGAACRYYLFPYDFEDAWGRVRLTGGRILLEDLRGRHGGGVVYADGVINSSRAWAGFDLRFHGLDVPLDDDLYAALPEQYRQLWERAAPLGLCDVDMVVGRPDGSEQTGALKTDVTVEARLRGGSLRLGEGQRLTQVDGWLAIEGGVVRLQDLHGYQGDSSVRVDGTVQLTSGLTQTDLRVEVADLPIEHQAALALGGADSIAKLHVDGLADIWGRVYGADPTGVSGQHLAVHLKAGELSGVDPTRVWTVTDGWVRVRGTEREIISLTCQQGSAQLDVAGTLPPAGQPGRPLTLKLHANTPALEELHRQFVPDQWARRIDDLGLAGPGDVTLRLRPDRDDPATARQAADIDLYASRMKAGPLPLELRDVSASLTLAPGRFRLRQATAEWGQAGRIRVQQEREGTWQDGQVHADFNVTAHRLVCGPELIAALPEPLARLLEKLSARGEFDAFLPRVSVSGGSPRTWRLEGSLPLRSAAVQVGLELTDFDGILRGVCSLGPDGEVELDASVAVERGRLAGRLIEDWDGQLLRLPGDRWVRLENLHGRLCDGVAQGTLRIDPQSSEYELAVKLHDVSAAQLLPPAKNGSDHGRRGRIDADLWLRGIGQDPAARHGGGLLRIRDASFVQTPVLASVFQQRITPAISDRVDRAQVRFLLEGRQVRLERIDIWSRDLRLVGEGSWNMRDDAIQMTLWAAHPDHWPRLAVISQLLESAGQELVQYHVEGTLAAPRVSTEPLHKLSEVLRRLLGSEE
jgi:hypothetical protein